MKTAYRETRFSPSKEELLTKAQAVLAEYAERGITMTLRQLYYQLVAGGTIPNNLREYKSLTALVTTARYAGLVDWDAIDDNLRKPSLPLVFGGIADLMDAAVGSYKLDWWAEMKNYVELYTEKDALSSVLSPIAGEFRIPFQVNRGYASASSMYEAAQRFLDAGKRGKNCVILYLGDHDPSGLDMVRDIRARLLEFGAAVNVQHVALTGKQIEKYKPPPNPAKFTDTRAKAYIAEFGRESWEVDALKPDVMIDLVRNSVSALLDAGVRNMVVEREKREKQEIKRKFEVD